MVQSTDSKAKGKPPTSEAETLPVLPPLTDFAAAQPSNAAGKPSDTVELTADQKKELARRLWAAEAGYETPPT